MTACNDTENDIQLKLSTRLSSNSDKIKILPNETFEQDYKFESIFKIKKKLKSGIYNLKFLNAAPVNFEIK